MNRFFKQIILGSSAVILLCLGLEAWRENLSMDWQKYQHKYKKELLHRAQTEQDRTMAQEFEVKMRQIVIPEIKSFDRCITCHVAIEDSRMKDMPNPLKSHPGNYLDSHDMNKVGCTACHDGQGRAVAYEDAHAKGVEKFWEKPLLKKPFIESTCVRCHADSLNETTTYNLGKQLFQEKACFACHSIGDIGGANGPALSDIGRASFHAKMPTHENRSRLLEKFDQNVNLAYLYESLMQPEAQPSDSTMKIAPLAEPEVLALMVYLKSLSAERRAMDVGISKVQQTGGKNADRPAAVTKIPAPAFSGVTGGSSKGYLVFSRACVTCHSVGEGDRVGPDLQGVVSRREKEWLKRFIQYPSKMIESKDPVAMELLAKYKTPMVDMGLTDEQVEEVIRYLENPKDISVASGVPEPAGSLEAAKDSQKSAADLAEISKGSDLFQGKQRFLNRGAACISCHDVRNDAVWAGGEMAKDLTDAFTRLGSVAVPAIIKNPPFPVMQAAYKDKPLTEDEITAVTSFLENVSSQQGNQMGQNHKTKMVSAGVFGLVVLLLVYAALWMNRRKRTINKAIYDRQKKSEKEI